MEVPALHGGLPGLRRVGRRQRRPGIDWLDAEGDFDDTLLMYSSDQGFFLGDHGWFDKRFMYEESLRMPFLLSYPRRLPGGSGLRRHRDQRRHGADHPRRGRRGAPPRMQGRSFWGDLHRRARPARRPRVCTTATGSTTTVFHKARRTTATGRTDTSSSTSTTTASGCPAPGRSPIRRSGSCTTWQTDPAELRNVYDDPRYREVREAIEAPHVAVSRRGWATSLTPVSPGRQGSDPLDRLVDRDATASSTTRRSCQEHKKPTPECWRPPARRPPARLATRWGATATGPVATPRAARLPAGRPRPAPRTLPT